MKYDMHIVCVCIYMYKTLYIIRERTLASDNFKLLKCYSKVKQHS